MRPDTKNIINSGFPESELYKAISDENKLALRETLYAVHNKEVQNNLCLEFPQLSQDFFHVPNDLDIFYLMVPQPKLWH